MTEPRAPRPRRRKVAAPHQDLLPELVEAPVAAPAPIPAPTPEPPPEPPPEPAEAAPATAWEAAAPSASSIAARLGIAPPGSRGAGQPGIATGRSAPPPRAEPAARPPPPPPLPERRPPAAWRPPGAPARPLIAPAGSARAAELAEPVDNLAGIAAAALAAPATGAAIRQSVDARTRRQRFAEAAPAVAAAEPMTAPPAPKPRLALLLVTRNHQTVLAEAWHAWRELLPGFELRAAVLDLGSVDDTLAVAEAEHLPVVRRPGGLLQPVASLRVGLRHAPGDIVLVADADTPASTAGVGLAELVRAGAVVAVAAGARPALLAVDRRALADEGDRQVEDLDSPDIGDLAGRWRLALRIGGVAERGAAAPPGLVERAWRPAAAASRVAPWARRLRSWAGWVGHRVALWAR